MPTTTYLDKKLEPTSSFWRIRPSTSLRVWLWFPVGFSPSSLSKTTVMLSVHNHSHPYPVQKARDPPKSWAVGDLPRNIWLAASEGVAEAVKGWHQSVGCPREGIFNLTWPQNDLHRNDQWITVNTVTHRVWVMLEQIVRLWLICKRIFFSDLWQKLCLVNFCLTVFSPRFYMYRISCISSCFNISWFTDTRWSIKIFKNMTSNIKVSSSHSKKKMWPWEIECLQNWMLVF